MYKFSDKVGLDFTFIWVHEIAATGSGIDENETSSRGTGTQNTKWRFDYTARHGETSRVFHLNFCPFLTGILTIKWVKVSISFNFMFFILIRDDPSRSELVRVDPTRNGGPS